MSTIKLLFEEDIPTNTKTLIKMWKQLKVTIVDKKTIEVTGCDHVINTMLGELHLHTSRHNLKYHAEYTKKREKCQT